MSSQNLNFNISKIKAIIGLGNPGSTYYFTRHSIGFRIIDQIAIKFETTFYTSNNMEYVQIKTSDFNFFLIKPLTFMNHSGKIMPFLQKKGIKSEEVLVIHDELEKKFGKILIKYDGSAKGHNGLRSLISFMGPNFWRLQFGIGRPENKDDVGSFVLTNFSEKEAKQIPILVKESINLIFDKF